MTTDGPDMTPRGLAEAIGQLVADLPDAKDTDRASASWQKVLTLQVLQSVLEGTFYAGHEEQNDLRRVAAYALRAAIEDLLRGQPALLEALVAAFDVEDWTYERPDGFASSRLGLLIAHAASQVWGERKRAATE